MTIIDLIEQIINNCNDDDIKSSKPFIKLIPTTDEEISFIHDYVEINPIIINDVNSPIPPPVKLVRQLNNWDLKIWKYIFKFLPCNTIHCVQDYDEHTRSYWYKKSCGSICEIITGFDYHDIIDIHYVI